MSHIWKKISRPRIIPWILCLRNLGYAQNLHTVISAIELIQDVHGFRVHLVRDGSRLDKLKEAIYEKNLEDIIKIYGRRPVEEMPEFYRLADACLLSLTADNGIGHTLPSKVQGYMAAGKPVIGMIDGSARNVIEESGCVAANDIKGMAATMKDFITNPAKYKDCGQADADISWIISEKIFIKNLEDKFTEMAGEKVNVGIRK